MRFFKYTLLLVALAALVVMTGDRADASGMGFRYNKQICGAGGGAFGGLNLVALPLDNPYQNAEDVCQALNMASGPGAGGILRTDGTTLFFHQCGGGLPFALVRGEGIIALNPTPTSGVLAGSHPDGGAVFQFDAIGPGLQGTNIYPVPYNSTAVNAENLCQDAGLTPLAGLVVRSDCSARVAHSCGGGAPFTLQLGEAVIIQNDVNLNYTPSHF